MKLTEKDIKGLDIRGPEVFEYASRFRPKARREQMGVCDRILEIAEGDDRTWIANYRDCLYFIKSAPDVAERASNAARRYMPAFLKKKFTKK